MGPLGKFLLMPIGLALAPVAIGVILSVPALVRASGGTPWIDLAAMSGGSIALCVLWVVAPRPVRVYVLGHELTHALWGMIFGAKACDLRVGGTGGSVRLTKTNVLITLSPYFFPFYTAITAAAALVTRLCVGHLPCRAAWLAAIGFTWAFHACFTFQSLCERQSDVEEYGKIFSWSLILLMNALGAVLWIVGTAKTPPLEAAAVVGRGVAEVCRVCAGGVARAATAAKNAFSGESRQGVR